MADSIIPLKLTGREVAPTLPPLLQPTTTAARDAVPGAGGRQRDPFLPEGYLTARQTFDVGASARDAAGGGGRERAEAKADEILVLELADGSMLVTSAGRLRDSLEGARPELLGEDGEILLEQLRAEGAASRGSFGEAVGGLVSRVFKLAVGDTDEIVEDAIEALGGGAAARAALRGTSRLGTRALMRAIENKLDREPGLYRWDGGTELAVPEADFTKKAPVDKRTGRPAPMLVFVHGTGSSTLGSFGDLRRGERADLWRALDEHYTGGIYAFEHRTLSESPIDNALALVEALPPGARLSLVSHSRGGLVADLLCVRDFGGLAERYRRGLDGERISAVGEVAAAAANDDGDPGRRERRLLAAEVDDAHAEQRECLRRLAGALAAGRPVVERYVRVASPAHGTRLASGNFDLFLSGLLSLLGQVPFFFGSPWYSAFKRVVIEIARNRTDPHLVPGIEAMLPDSPLARLLRDAPVQDGICMAVIAGDSDGGHLLRRLGLLLTDFLLFDNEANDLVVDTAAMLAGVAAKSRARVLFDRGDDVSHFRYFANQDTRSALRDWLVDDEPLELKSYAALPGPDEFEQALAAAATASRSAAAAERPVVVVLPGIMGSNLKAGGDRVWFDLPDLVGGGLARIGWDQKGIETDDLFARSYGKLCNELSRSHRVERFAYDWRQPLDVLAERLGSFLDKLLKDTQQPVRLLAHSMGGLVVRACIHKRRPVMDALMSRKGAQLVMLGTPHQGAHSMVENLIGKGDMLRTLAVLDLEHGLQQVLDLVAGFRGALQLLPRPGFVDVFQDQEGGGDRWRYWDAGTWRDWKDGNDVLLRDPWFGDGCCATPDQATLDEAGWLWRQDDPAGTGAKPVLPADYERKCVYVFGIAPNTPCGVRVETDWRRRRRLRMVGTALGDGTVTWESGRIGGIGSYYYMPAPHGDMASTPEHFDALVDLLASGATARLATSPPAVRAVERPVPVGYDAGPPTLDDPLAAERKVMGGSLRGRLPARTRRRLQVSVRAEDLRFLSMPIMVGHYEQDPIAGPEALIDRELLDGELSQRRGLGLYAGACGTATVVLRAPNDFERARGSFGGAVVTGLGRYDGALSMQTVTEAVRTGVLRYLLQVIDVLGKEPRRLPLATLLLGYNSSASMSVNASVEALATGVMEANARFQETTGLDIHVDRLDIVELYLDTAITAVYALRALAPRLAERAAALRTAFVAGRELTQGEGFRQRLYDNRSSGYWPRLIVTDADRNDAKCPPECYDALPSPCGPAADGADAPAPRTRLADNLRFLYVGQRARAESVVQQRQPGLVETLVRQQIHSTDWQPDFGRMLFQLMVPPDFKDAARQLERVVLVVDSATANLPWELMLADDPAHPDAGVKPLALRTAVVRQLASSRFRRQVRQGAGRKALVIGNPSVEGFAEAFPDPRLAAAKDGAAAQKDPPDLPGAESEAQAVVALLRGLGYEADRPEIGAERTASEVLAALYREPYRLLHISGHGVYGLRHRDGRLRSGVVLSGGLLVTAAEIDAMETVPELVFLNCCHLGQVDAGRDGNRLAASVARELIEIGVRCIVVAGWAVNDASASHFGQAFYKELLLHRRPFGEAVFEARQSVWRAYPKDITWGAFQAYGDAGWRIDPRADESSGQDDEAYASLDELFDRLARLRASLSRRKDRQGESETRALVRSVEDTLKKRCPPGWLVLPQLQSAIGATWRDLGRLQEAREAFLQAVRAEDKAGRVPIRDIEQLANIEARLGQKRGEAEAAGEEGDRAKASSDDETPLQLIELAIARLQGLDKVVGSDPDADAPETGRNAERCALLGSAWKRLAAYRALKVLDSGASAAEKAGAAERMVEAVTKSVQAYRRAEGMPGGASFRPYHALNRLALDALTPWKDANDRDASVALAGQCRQAAAQSYARRPDVWDALIQAEALLVGRLLDGSLGRDDAVGQGAWSEVVRAYADNLRHIPFKPSELDSVTSHMRLLARLHDALAATGQDEEDDKAHRRIAARLLELARLLQPNAPSTRGPGGGGTRGGSGAMSTLPDAPDGPPPGAASVGEAAAAEAAAGDALPAPGSAATRLAQASALSGADVAAATAAGDAAPAAPARPRRPARKAKRGGTPAR